MGIIEKIKNNKKVAIALLILLLFFIMLIKNGVDIWKSEQNEVETEEVIDDTPTYTSDDTSVVNEDYQRLLARQAEYEVIYGKLPEGFLWNTRGELLSIGDRTMTAEESVYAYFQGLSSLDFGTAQRYSRNSTVVETYNDFFSKSYGQEDYYDQFIRSMYRECLLSLEVGKVLNSSTFAENKIVFTVECKILDLTAKDFWKDDEMDIFNNLYVYGLEDDSTRGDIYLYNYILDYYRSKDALKRTTTFDITCERFADVESGWLVSIDSDVDAACRYRDGTLVVSYINAEYRDRGREEIEKLRNPETEEVVDIEDETENQIDWNNDMQDLDNVDIMGDDGGDETEDETNSVDNMSYDEYWSDAVRSNEDYDRQGRTQAEIDAANRDD